MRAAAAATLAAYAIGLLPFVLMRSVTVTFLARGDTLDAGQGAVRSRVAVNVALKIALMDRYAQVGLAFATSIGAWINFALLVWFAARRDLLVIDERLKASAGKLALAGLALAVALYCRRAAVPGWLAGWPALRDEVDARAARGARRRRLWRHRVRAVRPAVARRCSSAAREAPRRRRLDRRLIIARAVSPGISVTPPLLAAAPAS